MGRNPEMKSERRPTRYDPHQRALAARIERANAYWHVEWGVGSRRYYGYPLFGAPPGTIVSATDPEGLITEMRRTEYEFKISRTSAQKGQPE
jgi:hypothetical protein